jgi:hypothetical protein
MASDHRTEATDDHRVDVDVDGGCPERSSQDYAHQQPSLTAQKLRRLELAAGAPVGKGKPSGVWVTHQKMRQAESSSPRRRRHPTSG